MRSRNLQLGKNEVQWRVVELPFGQCLITSGKLVEQTEELCQSPNNPNTYQKCTYNTIMNKCSHENVQGGKSKPKQIHLLINITSINISFQSTQISMLFCFINQCKEYGKACLVTFHSRHLLSSSRGIKIKKNFLRKITYQHFIIHLFFENNLT